jgi:tetratricopeptide (TPR) repeat protein
MFKKNIASLLGTLFIVCLFSMHAGAQGNDKALADQYLASGDYEKAAAMYDKIIDRDPYGVYPNYLRCLLAMQDFDKAEKLVKRQQKKQEGNLALFVDLGQVYELQNQNDKARQQYEKAIKLLQADQQQIVLLANAFSQRQQWDYALQTYLQGKKLLKDSYPFDFEMAEIYFQKGEFTSMIEEYLDAVENNPTYQQSIQNILQSRIATDPDGSRNEAVRLALLRRIQRNADRTEFSEMLIWLLIQQKDFDAAFIQARAIDKRKREDGSRLVNLAMLSASNLNYDAAIKCYQYLIEKGRQSPYYITARMELLNTMNKKITASGQYTTLDLQNLEKDYTTTLDELGRNAGTASLIRGLAHLQVFYLGKEEEATQILEEAISYPGISPATQAECKLELGDIYLFTGNVWDSALLYSQVDKAFKNDPMGQEAKFRNARLDYFRGDFVWAQAQLDVLKSATSQLISNDAMALSLLISDNMDADSSNLALLLFSKADLLSFRRKDDEALLVFDSVLAQYPGHSLTDDVWFREARIMERKKNYVEEDTLLSKIITQYGDDILADDALFTRAALYENQLANKQRAMELYQDLLTNYPGSLFVVEARKRYRALRGDILN